MAPTMRRLRPASTPDVVAKVKDHADAFHGGMRSSVCPTCERLGKVCACTECNCLTYTDKGVCQYCSRHHARSVSRQDRPD